jgi:hypothetical protein
LSNPSLFFFGIAIALHLEINNMKRIIFLSALVLIFTASINAQVIQPQKVQVEKNPVTNASIGKNQSIKEGGQTQPTKRKFAFSHLRVQGTPTVAKKNR